MLRQTVMCSSEKTKASPQNPRWVNRIIMVLRMIMLTMSRRRGLNRVVIIILSFFASFSSVLSSAKYICLKKNNFLKITQFNDEGLKVCTRLVISMLF